MDLKKLIEAANAAKDARFFEPANAAFAIIVASWSSIGPWQGQWPLFTVRFLSQDVQGGVGAFGQAYYDIFVIDAGGESLTIPLPLVGSVFVAELMKVAAWEQVISGGRASDQSPTEASVETRRQLWLDVIESSGCTVAEVVECLEALSDPEPVRRSLKQHR